MIITTHYWDRRDIFPSHPFWIDFTLDNFNSGIDIFFCLSGFLIYGIFQKNYEKFGKFNFLEFYKKRLLRTLPAYWVFLGVTAIYFGTKPQYTDVMHRFWNDLFFVSNYKLGFHIITWSLSLEEQFYLTFPWIAILLFIKTRNKTRIWIQLILWTFPIFVRYYTYTQMTEISMQAYREILYYPMHVHFGGFMIGMLVYEIYYQYRDKETKSMKFSQPVYFGLLTFAIASLIYQHSIFFNDVAPYYCIFRTSILELTIGTIMLLSLSKDSIVDRFLSIPFFTPLARISYGMYLWNIVFCAAIWKSVFGGSYTQKQSWVAAFIGYFIVNGALFVWAAVLYRYTEHPFLKIKDRNKVHVSLVD